MKHLFVILSFAGLLAQTFNRFFIVMDYELNKEYIAKNLCVNKNKPKMRCHGKCQMMKKMQEEEKKDRENAERRMENKFEAVSLSDNLLNLSQAFIVLPSLEYGLYRQGMLASLSFPPFHPPQV